MTTMTTPLEREILTHYHCYPGPFRGGSENWTPHIFGLVEGFVARGLLEQVADGRHLKIVPNRLALEAYMEALAKVPLPVQQWVVPNDT